MKYVVLLVTYAQEQLIKKKIKIYIYLLFRCRNHQGPVLKGHKHQDKNVFNTLKHCHLQ